MKHKTMIDDGHGGWYAPDNIRCHACTQYSGERCRSAATTMRDGHPVCTRHKNTARPFKWYVPPSPSIALQAPTRLPHLTHSPCPCGDPICTKRFIDQAGTEGRWSAEDAEFICNAVNAALDAEEAQQALRSVLAKAEQLT